MKTATPPPPTQAQKTRLSGLKQALAAQIADTAQALLSAVELLAQLDAQLGLLRKTVERVQQSHLDALDYLEMTALLADEEDILDIHQFPPMLQDCASADQRLAWAPWPQSLSLSSSASASMPS